MQAADIVLVDDNFATIVAAVEEGRRVYDNIQKFIVYLLSCNSAEIFVMLIAVAVGLPTPFTSIMILWVNIIADVPVCIEVYRVYRRAAGGVWAGAQAMRSLRAGFGRARAQGMHVS